MSAAVIRLPGYRHTYFVIGPDGSSIEACILDAVSASSIQAPSFSMASVVLCATSLSPPFFRLRGLLEKTEPLVPEPVKERAEIAQALPPGAVEAPGAATAHGHQPSRAQDGKVLRDGRARHVKVRRDLADGKLPVQDEAEDRPPPWFRDCLEGRIQHERRLAYTYVSVN